MGRAAYSMRRCEPVLAGFYLRALEQYMDLNHLIWSRFRKLMKEDPTQWTGCSDTPCQARQSVRPRSFVSIMHGGRGCARSSCAVSRLPDPVSRRKANLRSEIS